MATSSGYKFPILTSTGTATTTQVDFADMFVCKEDFLDAGMYAWGYNSNGGLGLLDLVHRSSPVQVGSLTNWKQVTGGSYHTAAISTTGNLYAWGFNGHGNLGLNDTTSRSSPAQVGLLTNWKLVSGGWNHTAAIKTDGTLWTWGQNENGQLGLNDCTSATTLKVYSSPIQVGTNATWFMVDSTLYNSAYTTTTNALFVAGANTSGQLGLSDTTSRSSPVQVGALTNWKQVALGNSNSQGQGFALAVKTDGTLWAWGHNLAGQLGYIATAVGTSSPQQIGAGTTWAQVAAGPSQSFAITTANTLWAWGNNDNGRLGLLNITHRSSPVQVGSLTNWAKVSTGTSHTIAIKTDGTLWSWGNNTNGELGLLDITNRSSPVQVGSLTTWKQPKAGVSSSYAVKTDGTLWAWGLNGRGQLGLLDITNRSSPTQVGSLTTWMTVNTERTSNTVGSSDYASCWATRTNGTLWAWGWNSNNGSNFGSLLGLNTGTDVSSPTQVGSLTTWQSRGVVVGATGIIYDAHSSGLALTTAGALYAWGDNTIGQKGITPIGGFVNANRSSPVQVGSLTNWKLVSCGWYHTAALKTDGTLWTWGNNVYGSLGLNDITHRSSPVQVGSLTNWKHLDTNVYTSAAITSNGALWTWGNNSIGQLGQLDFVDRSSPVQVGSFTNWKQVSTGNTTMAIKTDGTLWAWGRGTNGQLGINGIIHVSSPVQVGSFTNWKQVSVGLNRFALAVKTDGTLWAWGDNYAGQLGLLDITHRSSPVQVGSLTNWKLVSAGADHTVAISSPDLP